MPISGCRLALQPASRVSVKARSGLGCGKRLSGTGQEVYCTPDLVFATALVCSLYKHSWLMCCLVAQVQPDSLNDLACVLEGDRQLPEHDTLPKQKGQQDGETDLSMVLKPLKQGAGGQCANDALEDLHSGRRQSVNCWPSAFHEAGPVRGGGRRCILQEGQHLRWRCRARDGGQDW